MSTDLAPIDTAIALKANVLHSFGVSTFLFLSIVTIAEKKNHNRFIPISLLGVSVLILIVTCSSFADEFYNRVANYDGDVSLYEHFDAIMHILIVILLILIQLVYVFRIYK